MSKPLTYPANRNYEKGVADERERIINIILSGKWVGESLEEDIAELTALIKGENK